MISASLSKELLGPLNAITDVPGIEIGQKTLIAGEGPLRGRRRTCADRSDDPSCEGQRPGQPVYGGFFDLNGNGEISRGADLSRGFGDLRARSGFSDTNAVGQVYAGIQQWTAKHLVPRPWPVVAETYGAAGSAILRASTSLPQRPKGGARQCFQVGPGQRKAMSVAGPGVVCFGFKGGIGTASRVVSILGKSYTVGVLTQCNTGYREVLRIAGVPVGAALAKRWLPCFDPKLSPKNLELPPCTSEGSNGSAPPDQGSIIIVVGTDAPLMPVQLNRVAKRAALGLARLGSLFRQCVRRSDRQLLDSGRRRQR